MKENLSKMLTTLGILSSMPEAGLDVIRERFDIEKIESQMEELSQVFVGVSEEDSMELAYELLGDMFPDARRSSAGEEEILQSA